jgi:hypothetical protein
LLLAGACSSGWTQGVDHPHHPPQDQKTETRSAAAGGSAIPTEDPAAARRLFRELDTNADGYLTGDELWSERGRADNWAAVDRNRDGRISPDEFTVVRPR